MSAFGLSRGSGPFSRAEGPNFSHACQRSRAEDHIATDQGSFIFAIICPRLCKHR